MSRSSTPSWDEFHRDSRPTDELRRAPVRVSFPPMRPKGPKKKRRVLGKFLLGLGVALGALVLNVNSEVERRWIGELVSKIASSKLRGSIAVRDVEHVGLHGIDVGSIEVRDPKGTRVAVIEGVHLRYGIGSLIHGLVDGLTIDRLDVALVDDGEGSPTIAQSFQPKEPSAPSPPDPNGMRLVVNDVDVREVRIVGKLSGKTIGAHGDLRDAALSLAPDGTRIAVPSLAVDASPITGVLPAPVRVRVAADVVIPAVADPRVPGVNLRSLAAEIESAGATLDVSGTMVAGHVDLHVDAGAGPDAIATFTGAPPPLWAPVDVHLDLGGTLDVADVAARVKTNGGDARVNIQVALEALRVVPTPDRPRVPLATGSIRLDALDVRTFAPTAPPIRANADLALVATETTKGTELSVVSREAPLKAIVTDPFEKPARPSIGETILAVEGKALLKKDGGVDAVGSLHASLERARLDVDGRFEGGLLDAHVRVDAPALSEIRALKLPVRGGVHLDVTAHADVPKKTFAASGTVRALEVIEGSIEIPSVVANLSAQGTFDQPTFALDLYAPKVKSMAETTPSRDDVEQLRDLRLAVVGTKRAFGVHASVETVKDQRLVLDTHLVPDPKGMRVVGLDADVKRETFHAKLHVDEIAADAKSGAVTVKGMRLWSTAGGMRLEAFAAPKEHRLDLEVASTDLDVNALAWGAGFDLKKVKLAVKLAGALHTVARSQWPGAKPNELDAQGTFGVDGDAPVGIPPERAIAHDAPVLFGAIDVSAKGALQTSDGEKKLDGALSLTVEDRYVKASVRGALEDVLGLGVYGGGTLGGRWDDPRAWRDVVGHVDLHVPKVRLEKLAAFVRDLTGRPLGAEVSGKATLNVHLERGDPRLPPLGDVELVGEKMAAKTTSTTIDPLDGHVRVRLQRSLDPARASDEVLLAVRAFVHDANGKLLDLDASTRARWATLMDLGDGGGVGETATSLPTYVRLEVPERPIQKLPSPLRSAIPFAGTLGVKLAVDGTVGDPRVALDATLAHVKAGNAALHAIALHATYDGKLARAEATIRNEKAREGRKPELDAVAEVKLVEADLVRGNAAPAWTAKLDATLDELPLGLFSSLSADAIAGAAFGEVHVDHVNDPNARAATVKVDLGVDGLMLGDAVFDTTKITASVDDARATADVSLQGESGSLTAKADVPLVWKNAASPALAPNAPLKASIATKDLRLRIAEPFVAAVDQLDGYLDTKLDVDVTPKTVNGKTTMTGGANGTVKIRDGVMIVGAIGEPWKDVDGEIRVSPTSIEVPKLTLHGLTGSADVSASAKLENLVPKSFHVQLDPDKLPFATQGVPIGALSGSVAVDGTIDPKLVGVNVKVEKLTLDLAPTSDKKPQDLEPEPSIVVMQPLAPPKPPPAPGGTPMKIVVQMPNDVWVRRDDLHVAVTGNPAIEVKDVPRFTGEVQIDPTVHPWIEQFGKRFTIAKANVRFDGTAELNPTLDVAVKWSARDGTDVTIAVAGRLKTPKVTMTADPPATQAEIMSLLVLGRRDAGSASQQEQASRGAAAQTASLVQGMTGAVLGQQLQKMLPTEMTLDFQPGDQGFSDARYAGGYQWKNVYFEVGYNAGAGNASMQPGSATQTNARTTFGVDWRFKPEWSLMTTLGDTGSALVDLLWNFRY